MSMESFDWDSEKDRRNRAKHGVSFEAAQYAFFDSGLVFGDGANKFMSRKTKYTDEPLGRVRVVPDFLPSPEALVPRDDTVKITIALSKSSVAFFKREAAKHNTQYQKMIRRLLDAYTESHEKSPRR